MQSHSPNYNNTKLIKFNVSLGALYMDSSNNKISIKDNLIHTWK